MRERLRPRQVLYSLVVHFDPDDLPARCVQVFTTAPGADYAEVRDVELTGWHTAQTLVEEAPSGGHGLRWNW